MFAGINCTVENGTIGARSGFGFLAERSSFNHNDVCYGACYCEYDGSFEYLAVIKRSGDSKARLWRYYVSGGAWTCVEVTNGATADAGEWSFTQFDNYVYGVNANDVIILLS